MKCIIQAYLPLNGVKEVTTQSIGKEPSQQDRVTFNDRYGSQLQVEVGVLYNALEFVAKSRNMSITDYLDKIKVLPNNEGQ